MAYLVFETNHEVNVAPVLERLDRKHYRNVEEERGKVVHAFRQWMADNPDDTIHHGWPTDHEFRMGYVFKWDHQRQHRRLYGFLTTPRPWSELCVLCCFRAKEDFETDDDAKTIVRAMSQHPEVKEAVKRVFGSEESWRVN